jgi:hypothetical protein
MNKLEVQNIVFQRIRAQLKNFIGETITKETKSKIIQILRKDPLIQKLDYNFIVVYKIQDPSNLRLIDKNKLKSYILQGWSSLD